MAVKKSVNLTNPTKPVVKQDDIEYNTTCECELTCTAKSDSINDMIIKKKFSVDACKTKMLFSPAAFESKELYSLLNNDDTMSLEIRVLDPTAKIRNNPNIASTCIYIAKQGDIFEVSKQFKGWFYVDSLRGWIESDKTVITNVIRPYDPDADIDFDSNGVPVPNEMYNAKDIIESIKNSNYKIPSYVVTHTHKRPDGTTEESLLSLLLEQLINSRDLYDSLVEKVGTMPKIPSLKEGEGLTLVSEFDSITGKYKVVWKKLNYDDVTNVPETGSDGVEEF